MKSVVTSFSMTLSQASALAEATKRIKNRSAWINDAIEKKILKMDAFSLSDVSDAQLMYHYHIRFCIECNDPTTDFATCPTFLILSRMVEKKSESGN